MADVKISELNLLGYDLFNDSESFLNELATQDSQIIEGGGHSGGWSHSGGGFSHGGGWSHGVGFSHGGGWSHSGGGFSHGGGWSHSKSNFF